MKDCLFLKTPASWHRDMWREASPIGSGLLGGLVYGAVGCETIAVNHARLWHRGEKMDVPDISQTLAQTRQAMDAGDYKNANWISTLAIKKAGFSAKLGMPCPLCDFTFDMGEREPFKNYARTLRMDLGEVTVSWNEREGRYARRAFLSRARDLLAVEMTAAGGKLDVTLGVSHHDTGEDDTKAMLERMSASFHYSNSNPFLSFSAVNEDGIPFGAVAKIVTDGSVKPFKANLLEVTGAAKITLFAKFFVGSPADESVESLKRELAQLEGGYNFYLEEHRALHEPLYRCADISFGADSEEKGRSNEQLLLDAYGDHASCELLTKLWHFGRYLMVCGTREDSLPFPLYGLWHGRYSMPWPHNMANENVQMIYWHVLSGGLHYTIKPLIEYYMGMMDQFRQNAKNIFGLPGIYMPAGTTPGNGVPNQIVPVIMNWIGSAGWMAQHFYSYYEYTGCDDFLKDTILPFMREAGLFYEAYLVMGADGLYKVYPSVSPENTPNNLMPPKGSEHMSHPCPSVINATMDIAIIKELFTNLTKAGKNAGLYDEDIPRWEAIIEKLPVYQKTEEGNIKEWMYPGLDERYDHRHLSHIYPVFPGREFVKGRDDPAWLHAFELSVDKRKLGAQSGWSLAHMSCIYARFERPEKAIECLDNLAQSCLLNSFYTLHNDWRNMGMTLGRGSFAPIQLDASMGVVNALQEMLLFVSDGIVKLLPALPKRLSKGSVKDLRFMTGQISFEWDAQKGTLAGSVTALRDTDIAVILPHFINNVKAVCPGGSEVALASGDRVKLSAGESLLFSV